VTLQPARPCPTRERLGRWAALARVSVDLGERQARLAERLHATFALKSATPYPSGVVCLHYERQSGAQ